MSLPETLLNLFIATAQAADTAPASSSGVPKGMPDILMFAALLALFYFLLIRPQQKRAKEHRNMIAALAKGDEIVSSGGLLGKVVGLEENFISLEIASGVIVRIQRHAVTQVMPKGTLKGS